MLLGQLVELFDLPGDISLKSEAPLPVSLSLILQLALPDLALVDMLSELHDLLGESIEPPLIGGAFLGLSLHEPLVVDDQVLDLGLQALVRMPQGHVLLGLPRDLVVAPLHLLLRLLVLAGQGQVLVSQSCYLDIVCRL